MNKKVLAAAIGAALVAGPMLANADVKVYGRVHVSVDQVDGKGTTTATGSNKNWVVASNNSIWGIDASEKLGSGLTAVAKLESQIDATGETTTQASNNRYVGLAGGWGTLVGGIHDTPYKLVGRSVDFFGDQIGDNRNLTNVGGNGGAGWDLRPANVVAYITPSFNGVTAIIAHVTDSNILSANTATDDNRNRADSLSVGYSGGPLSVAFAHETHRLGSAFGSGTVAESGTRLAASYDFGGFKLAGLWQDLNDLGATPSGSSKVKRKTWGLGGAFTAGNNVFKLQYYKADKLSNTSTGADADNTGATMWALGWDHLFSKSTKVYVAYAKTDNETAATFTVNGGGHGDTTTPGVGDDATAWSVGMSMSF